MGQHYPSRTRPPQPAASRTDTNARTHPPSGEQHVLHHVPFPGLQQCHSTDRPSHKPDDRRSMVANLPRPRTHHRPTGIAEQPPRLLHTIPRLHRRFRRSVTAPSFSRLRSQRRLHRHRRRNTPRQGRIRDPWLCPDHAGRAVAHRHAHTGKVAVAAPRLADYTGTSRPVGIDTTPTALAFYINSERTTIVLGRTCTKNRVRTDFLCKAETTEWHIPNVRGNFDTEIPAFLRRPLRHRYPSRPEALTCRSSGRMSN